VRILNYNPKLAWVTAGAALWSLLAFGWAVAWQGRPDAPLRLGYGPEYIIIEGRLVELEELPDNLVLTIAAAPDKQRVLRHDRRELAQLPPGLEIRFVAPSAGRRQPPRISLLPGSGKPRDFGRGRFEMVTRYYVVKSSGGIIRINHPPGLPGRGRGPGAPGGRRGRR